MYRNPFGFDDDGFGQFPGQRAAGAGAFSRRLRCYPVSFMARDELERGDKIILPPSALDILTRLNISYPMLFQLESLDGKKTHCGVLEFLAQEGHAYIPYWMMQNLSTAEGDMITIRNVVLEKGNFVKFQPQSVDFLSISNPKSVLEKSLRSFTCLSTGDSIPINYNGKDYWIDVLDVKPGDAVSIIETDINVDFAPPPGYVEPSAASSREPSTSKPGQVVFGGNRAPAGSVSGGSRRKTGDSSDSDTDTEAESGQKPLEQRFPGQGSMLRQGGTGRAFIPTASTDNGSRNGEEESEEKRHEFRPFGGTGHTLRGKIVPSVPTSVSEESPADQETTVEDEKPKFVPFGGTGRTLRG